MAERDWSLVAGRPRERTRKMVRGKICPVCGERTVRQRLPARMRPVRWLMGQRVTYRACELGHWRGLALHPGSEPPSAQRTLLERPEVLGREEPPDASDTRIALSVHAPGRAS